jgi:hypothetical protein
MKNEEQDDLWDLLGKLPDPKASPFFSRNVLRAVRSEDKRPEGFIAWLRARWVAPVALAGAAAAVALMLSGQKPVQSHPSLAPVDEIADTVLAHADYSVIADLEELLAADTTSLWLEADSSSL